MANVAYLGSMGSFSSLAALEMNDKDQNYIGYNTFLDVLDSVTKGESDIAILPVENTIAGTVSDSLDVLHKFPLSITAEHYLPVEQNLLVLNDTVKIEEITEIRSHQKAIEQCATFFREYLSPSINFVSDSDTVSSAIEVKERKDPSIAAISSNLAAEVHGLHVMHRSIQDKDENYTRFVKVVPEEKAYQKESDDKCSVVLDIPHRKGSLLNVFKILNDNGHNIMTANTRPIPERLWEYLFYIDFISEEGNDNIYRAIDDLKRFTNECHVLGIYANKSPMSWVKS